MYLIHYPKSFDYSDNDPMNAILRKTTYLTLNQCKKEGKIRSIGVSSYEIRHLEEIRQFGEVRRIHKLIRNCVPGVSAMLQPSRISSPLHQSRIEGLLHRESHFLPGNSIQNPCEFPTCRRSPHWQDTTRPCSLLRKSVISRTNTMFPKQCVKICEYVLSSVITAFLDNPSLVGHQSRSRHHPEIFEPGENEAELEDN